MTGIYAQTNTANIPQQLTVTDIDETSAYLSWLKDTSAYEYIVSYGTVLNQNTVTVTTEDTIIYISNLSSATQYVWRVRSVNDDSDTSDWSDLSSFYTLGYSFNCSEVEEVFLGSMTDSYLLLQWSADEDADYWEVVWDEPGTNPETTGKRVFTNNMEYSFELPFYDHIYQFAVRSHCISSFSNWKYVYIKYMKEDAVEDLPVYINFEDSLSNAHVGLMNGVSNPWVIGTYADYGGLSTGHSVYISNDGQTMSKDNKKSAVSYAYVDFFIPDEAVSYYTEFKYKSNMSSLKDGIKIYLTSNGSSLAAGKAPTDYYMVKDTLFTSTAGQWKDAHLELPSAYIGTYRRLLFVWTNSDTSQDNGSIAVDNISIVPRYCAVPTDLTAKSITSHSAELSWTITNNQMSYDLQIKTQQDTGWTTYTNITNNYYLTGLTESTEYFFRVKAVCSDEESFYSEIDSFKTHVISQAVDYNTITYSTTYDSAYFKWNAVQGASYYIVSYKENTFSSAWINVDTYDNSIDLGNLTPNTSYLFKVRAVNANQDTSFYTDNVEFATLCAPVTQYPYLYANTIDFNSQNGFVNVPVCYTAEPNTLYTEVFDLSQMDAALLAFDLYNTSSVVVYTSSDGGQTFVQSALIPATQKPINSYDSHMVTLDNVLMSDNVVIKFVFISSSAQTSIAKLKNISVCDACAAPKTINTDEIGLNYVQLSWSASDKNTAWRVNIYKNDGTMAKTLLTSSPSCTVTQLEENTFYKAVISSQCSQENSYDSSFTVFTTLSSVTQECQVPENFQAYWYKTKSNETIMATWTSDDDDNLWEVWYKELDALQWQTKLVTLDPVFTIRNIDQSVAYEIKVRTVCSPGDTSDFTQTDTVEINLNSLITPDGNATADIHLYPNPATDMITVDCGKEQINNVLIISPNGQTVLRSQAPVKTLDISRLKAGTYTLIGYINDRRYIKQFIKQ